MPGLLQNAVVSHRLIEPLCDVRLVRKRLEEGNHVLLFLPTALDRGPMFNLSGSGDGGKSIRFVRLRVFTQTLQERFARVDREACGRCFDHILAPLHGHLVDGISFHIEERPPEEPVAGGENGVFRDFNIDKAQFAQLFGEKFRELVDAVAKQIAAVKPADVEALLASDMGGKTVETYIQEQVAVIGEKISVRRFMVYEANGFVETYIHMGGTMGVMLAFDGEPTEAAKAVAHDVALHVAFAKPRYMTEAEVSAETLEKEKAILLQEVINEGKPQNIAEKFVKDDKVTVAQVLAKAGAGVSLKQFCFFVRGEGLEKKSEDLQEEVAKQVEAMKK